MRDRHVFPDHQQRRMASSCAIANPRYLCSQKLHEYPLGLSVWYVSIIKADVTRASQGCIDVECNPQYHLCKRVNLIIILYRILFWQMDIAFVSYRYKKNASFSKSCDIFINEKTDEYFWVVLQPLYNYVLYYLILHIFIYIYSWI